MISSTDNFSLQHISSILSLNKLFSPNKIFTNFLKHIFVKLNLAVFILTFFTIVLVMTWNLLVFWVTDMDWIVHTFAYSLLINVHTVHNFAVFIEWFYEQINNGGCLASIFKKLMSIASICFHSIFFIVFRPLRSDLIFYRGSKLDYHGVFFRLKVEQW